MIDIKKLFLISSKAGNGDQKNLIEWIKKGYKKHGREEEYNLIISKDKHHIRRAAQDFSLKERENGLVIVAGGDGSLGEVAQVLGGTDTALGLIPAGTANDFSKNFDYSNFTIENTFKPMIKPIDLMEINGIKCINIMSLGFDTHILKSTYDCLEKFPCLGKKAFILGVLKNLFDLKNENLTMDLILKDGRKIKVKDKFIIFALCNGAYYGSGFNPAPQSKLDDGILNLVLAKELNHRELFPLIFKYKKGKHLKHKKVSEYLASSGSISSSREFICNLDGEIFTTRNLEFKVLKDDLNWAFLGKTKG